MSPSNTNSGRFTIRKGAKKMTEKAEKKVESTLEKGLKAYGIDEKFVLSHRVYDNAVVIVTVGGAKVRWQPGDKPQPLDPIRVDGIIRKKMKPVTGTKRAGK